MNYHSSCSYSTDLSSGIDDGTLVQQFRHDVHVPFFRRQVQRVKTVLHIHVHSQFVFSFRTTTGNQVAHHGKLLIKLSL